LKIAIIQQFGSQAAFAATTHICESKLSRILNGWTRATPHEQRRMAAALGMSVGELFDSEKHETVAKPDLKLVSPAISG
jgi:plasmid maintenance system antidote protein VapI